MNALPIGLPHYTGDGLTREQRAQESAAEVRNRKVAERFAALWADPEVLSEVVTDLHGPLIYVRPGVLESAPNGRFTGTAAIAALRNGYFCEFGRLLHKACVDAVQARAEEQVSDEESES